MSEGAISDSDANGTTALFERVWTITHDLSRSCQVADGELDGDGHPLQGENVYDYLHAQQQHLSEPRKHPDGCGDYEPDHADKDVVPTAFGTQLAYLHNEFNFDAARPVRNFVLATHISFIPIFTPKWKPERHIHSSGPGGAPQWYIDELRLAGDVTGRYEDLRRQAVHEGDSFSGGKDSITSRFTRFLDYNKKTITTMRSIERMHDLIQDRLLSDEDEAVRHVGERAIRWNERFWEAVRQRGLSSRVSMIREYALRLGKSASTRLSWVRHHSHYQTVTAIEEASLDPKVVIEQQVGPIPAAPTLKLVLDRLGAITAKQTRLDQRRKDFKYVLSHTAFDSLPPQWADFLFGRYLQGANYLFIPGEILFSPANVEAAAHLASPQRNERTSLYEDWAALFPGTGAGANRDKKLPPISFAAFMSVWREAQRTPLIDRACSRLLFSLLRPNIVCSFPARGDIAGQEFCMCAASAGGAVILSNVKNMNTFGRERPGTMLMTETVIVDLGMNNFERGRLFKQLSEFSTERVRSLASLGTFRFLSDALDTVHNNLSKQVKSWLDAPNGLSEGDAHSLRRARTSRYGDRVEQEQILADRKFASTLKGVTIDLTILNDLVEGGISAHATAVSTAVERVHSRLEDIGEQRMAGFLSLSEFLERRFNRSVRIVAAVGRRYDLLRRRVAELSTLVETQIETNQRDDQRTLLEKVDRLTLFGITYYFGTALAYIAAPIVLLWLGGDPLHEFSAQGKLEGIAEVIKAGAFLALILGGIYLGLDVLRVLQQEIADAPRNWADARSEIARWAARNLDDLSG